MKIEIDIFYSEDDQIYFATADIGIAGDSGKCANHISGSGETQVSALQDFADALQADLLGRCSACGRPWEESFVYCPTCGEEINETD